MYINDWDLWHRLLAQRYGQRPLDVEYKYNYMKKGETIDWTAVPPHASGIPPYNSPFLDTAQRVSFTEHGHVGGINYLEQVVESGEVKMRVAQRLVSTETYQVNARVGTEIIKGLTLAGVNPLSETKSTLRNEAQCAREGGLARLYRELGQVSAREEAESTRWKRFLHGRLGIPVVEWVSEEDVVSALRRYANLIFARSLRGGADFAIVSRQMNAYLCDSPVYLPAVGGITTGGVQQVGTLGSMQIYVDHSARWDDQLIIGRRTGGNETGVYYCEHSHDIHVMEDGLDAGVRVVYAERCAVVKTGANAHKNYYVADLRIGKRPLWRKLLGV